jgi:hypothetical protein
MTFKKPKNARNEALHFAMSSNIGKPTLIPSSVVQIEKHKGADLLSKKLQKEE